MSTENNGEEAEVKILKEPLSMDELLGAGAIFAVDVDYDECIAAELYADFNDERFRQSLLLPCRQPFDELRPQMQQVEEHLWKRVVRTGLNDGLTVGDDSRIALHYNAFFEGEEYPFDSTYAIGRPAKILIRHGGLMDGIEAAVRTMQRNEQAEFLIGHQLLFGELGCPPRIKPRAAALYVIELVELEQIASEPQPMQAGDGEVDVEEEEQRYGSDNKLLAVEKRVRQLYTNGKDFFKRHMFGQAVRSFEQGVSALERCRLADEEEELRQRHLLLKLYKNLAVCYNKVNKPKRVCIVCKHIRRLTDNKPCGKMLFQEGRALLMLHDYERGRALLRRAQNLEPNVPIIAEQLRVANECIAKHLKKEQSLLSNAMEALRIVEQQNKPETTVRPSATAENPLNYESDVSYSMDGIEETNR